MITFTSTTTLSQDIRVQQFLVGTNKSAVIGSPGSLEHGPGHASVPGEEKRSKTSVAALAKPTTALQRRVQENDTRPKIILSSQYPVRRLASILAKPNNTTKWSRVTIGYRHRCGWAWSFVTLPPCWPSSSSCCRRILPTLLAGFGDGLPGVSTTPPCPIQSQLGMASLVRHRPRQSMVSIICQVIPIVDAPGQAGYQDKRHTRFLYALWMASRASLMVTPLRFRAVTSIPRGKCKSILLTGGLVRCSFKIEGSSTVEELLLIFLWQYLVLAYRFFERHHRREATYHPVFCVSTASSRSIPSASETILLIYDLSQD